MDYLGGSHFYLGEGGGGGGRPHTNQDPILSVYGDLCAPPNRRAADNPREINEEERPGRMRGPRDQKSPKISNHFFLFGYLLLGGTYKPETDV